MEMVAWDSCSPLLGVAHAADEPDGYWVPEDWVEGYVTELHRNTHPENAELRNQVLAAEAEYDRTGAYYEAVVDELCGDIAADEICYTTYAEEDRLDSAYHAYLLAWCRYVAVLNRAELAGIGLGVCPRNNILNDMRH